MHKYILEYVKNKIALRDDASQFEIDSDIDDIIFSDIYYKGGYIILFYEDHIDIRGKANTWNKVKFSDPTLFTKIDDCIRECGNWI